MSGTSMTREMSSLVDAFGYGLDDLQWFTINAMKSAFLPFDERLALINDVIKPGYAALAGPGPGARHTRAVTNRRGPGRPRRSCRGGPPGHPRARGTTRSTKRE